jgi:hypothetical protein
MAKQKKVKVEWGGMPTSDGDLKVIKASIDGTFDIVKDIENAKDDLTDYFKELHEKFGMPRRVFNFLVRTNYKGNASEVIDKNSELEEAYDALQKVVL